LIQYPGKHPVTLAGKYNTRRGRNQNFLWNAKAVLYPRNM